ncbi:MAG TPA: hypothetical protein VHO25_01325 [Polyangiaceae bacterium]|nr:hypothetical protein [Polyangiaceae bacterium]
MSLTEKLEELVEHGDRRGRAALTKAIRDVAVPLAAKLKEREWDVARLKSDRDFLKAIKAANDAADLVDAAEYVREKVLSRSGHPILDIRLSRSGGKANAMKRAQEQIDKLFDSNKAPRRGFVYVAWSRRPDQFYYVGKAKSVLRLNLRGHGNLVSAINEATVLSLLFPKRSNEETLLGVEASVIALVQSFKDKGPHNNTRLGSVPVGKAAGELLDLGKFLHAVGALIAPGQPKERKQGSSFVAAPSTRQSKHPSVQANPTAPGQFESSIV